jgi:hypothetical protein
MAKLNRFIGYKSSRLDKHIQYKQALSTTTYSLPVKKTIAYHKNERHHKMDSTIAGSMDAR